MGDIEGMFLDILLPKPKTNRKALVGIIYRHPNNISFSKCFEKHLDDIIFDNEIFSLRDFNVNILHNGKCIFKENQAMQSRLPSTSFVSHCMLFY